MVASVSRWIPALRTRDPRDFQIAALSLFLCLGVGTLDWDIGAAQVIVTIAASVATQLLAILITRKKHEWIRNLHSLKSALISSLSLCLLLRVDSLWIAALVSVIAISSKFILRVGDKHLFNPTNLAILVAMKLIGHAWISPAQWGNDLTLLFIVMAAGAIVLSRADRLEVSLSFLLSYFVFEVAWNVAYLGWPADFVLHKFTAGSLYLFAFFMITDPKTIPYARVPRIVWTISVGLLAAVLSNIFYMNAAPLWALVFMTPLSPLIDHYFPAARFQWQSGSGFHIAFWRKSVSALCVLIVLVGDHSTTVYAFCGFYAAKADTKLLNKSSQVIIAHLGNHTTVTMESDFQGDVRDFAMIIPVPEVLKKENVRVLSPTLFQTLNDYSTPRLAEYYDQGPCTRYEAVVRTNALELRADLSTGKQLQKPAVRVEAQYTVGEYDIVILSADESAALEEWLTTNGYKIPKNASDVIEPYIKSKLNFLVAKVNLGERIKAGFQSLRPLQISYNSDRYMLPIRLGMANANEAQDLTVYIFSARGQVETVNYRTVKLPTDKDIPLFVKPNFAKFYNDVFNEQYRRRHHNVVFMEYAWDLSPSNYMHCDPCTGVVPDQGVLAECGVNWLSHTPHVYLTRLHLRYDRASFPQDLSFIETYNTTNYQVRYVVHHPTTQFDCGDVNKYLDEVRDRREDEIENYQSLSNTSLNYQQADRYINELESNRKQ